MSIGVNITIGCLGDVVLARIYFQVCQQWLYAARKSGQPRAIVSVLECHFGEALDRLWEAQQRAA